jgi:hypothetical protein
MLVCDVLVRRTWKHEGTRGDPIPCWHANPRRGLVQNNNKKREGGLYLLWVLNDVMSSPPRASKYGETNDIGSPAGAEEMPTVRNMLTKFKKRYRVASRVWHAHVQNRGKIKLFLFLLCSLCEERSITHERARRLFTQANDELLSNALLLRALMCFLFTPTRNERRLKRRLSVGMRGPFFDDFQPLIIFPAVEQKLSWYNKWKKALIWISWMKEGSYLLHKRFENHCLLLHLQLSPKTFFFFLECCFQKAFTVFTIVSLVQYEIVTVRLGLVRSSWSELCRRDTQTSQEWIVATLQPASSFGTFKRCRERRIFRCVLWWQNVSFLRRWSGILSRHDISDCTNVASEPANFLSAITSIVYGFRKVLEQVITMQDLYFFWIYFLSLCLSFFGRAVCNKKRRTRLRTLEPGVIASLSRHRRSLTYYWDPAYVICQVQKVRRLDSLRSRLRRIRPVAVNGARGGGPCFENTSQKMRLKLSGSWVGGQH